MKKSLLLMLFLALTWCWTAKADVSVPYTEGFETMSSAADLTAAGWISYQSNSGSFLAIETTASNVHSGSKALDMDSWDAGSSSDYLIAGLPLMDADINNLQISFSYKVSTGSVYVGYLTDANDASTFVSVQSFSSSSNYSTIDSVSLASVPATAARIAIKYLNWYRCYIDDILVEVLPTCIKPTELEATLTPGNGSVATLSWTAGGSETAWVLEYGTASDFAGATSVNVSGNPSKDLTGLTPETTYYARVKADCGGGDESGYSSVIEFMPSNAYSLTINEGAATNSYVPVYGNWVDDITKSQFIIPASDLAAMQYGIINKLTFYSSSASVNWGVAEFEVYMAETSATTLSALEDYSSMEKVMNAGSLSISGNKMEVSLDNPYQYMGENLLIGFLQTVSGTYSSASFYGVSATSGASWGGYGTSINAQAFSPKVSFEYIPGAAPACPKPSNLVVSGITADAATLSWTAGGSETEWILEVATNSEFTGANQEGVSGNPSFELTGLEAQTTYYVRVQTDCGSEQSAWMRTSFTTACGAIASFPYGMGFEDSESVAFSCWSTIDADGDGYCWDISSMSSDRPAHTGSKVISSASYDNTAGALTPDNWLIMPAITLPAGSPKQLSWWERGQDASWASEKYSVYIATSLNAFDNYDPQQQETPMYTTTGSWVNRVINLNSYKGQTIYIAFRHFAITDMYVLNIDDISIEDAPTCIAPTDIVVTNFTSNSVTLSWTDNNEGGSSYIILDDNDDEIPASQLSNISSTGVTISGLAADTYYSFKIKASCSNTDFSDVAIVPTFYTGYCQPEPSCTSGTYGNGITAVNFGVGSSIVNNTNYPTSAPYYGDYHNLKGKAYPGVATSVEITFETGTEYGTIIWVDWNKNLVFEDNEIVYTGFSANSNPTILTASFDIPSPQELGDYRMRIGAAENYFDNFINKTPGTAQAHDACYSGGWSVVFHDYTLEVAEMPACLPPTGIAVSEIGTHSATISWTSDASAWQVGYSISGENSWSSNIDVPAATYTFSELVPESAYDVRVRTNCGDSQSDWVTLENAFTTGIACPAPSALATSEITGSSAKLEWTGTSAAYNIDYRIAASVASVLSEGFEDADAYSANWKVVNMSTANASKIGQETSAAHSGSYGFRFSSYSSASTYEEHLINKNELTGLTNGVIEFYYKKSNSSAESFKVGYSSTDNETTSFTFGDNHEATQDWQLFHEEIPAGTKYVSIQYTTTSCNWYLYIDDIVIGNTVEEGEWQHATSNEEFKTLTELDPETKYEAKVLGDCGTDGTSAWSDLVSFTTVSACQMPDGLAADNITASAAQINWNAYGQASFNLRYKESTATDWTIESNIAMPHAISSLDPNTSYEVQVQPTCADADDWSASFSFKTAYGLPFAPKFTSSTIPSDWSKSTSPANDVFAGSPMASASSSWYLTQSDTVIDAYHFRGNIYGTTWKNWIVTPAIDLSGASSSDMLILNFEAGLTAFSANNISTMYTGVDDRFIVAVSADGGNTWLQANATEWNNVDGNAQVYNGIPTHGKLYQINMSAFAGQVVKIGFYGESTVSNADNYFHFGKINLHKAEAYSLEIDASLYATYYNADDAFTMPENLTGHVFSTENTPKMLVQEYEAGDIVPAATPLVIEATAAGIYSLEPTMGGISPVAASQLVGVNEVTSAIETSSAHQFFVLSLNSNNDAGSIGFYYYDADHVNGGFPMVKAHKAYLKVPTSELPSGAPSAFFLFNGENGATWLENLEGVEGTVKFLHEGKIFILREGVIYDATGRQVRKL